MYKGQCQKLGKGNQMEHEDFKTAVENILTEHKSDEMMKDVSAENRENVIDSINMLVALKVLDSFNQSLNMMSEDDDNDFTAITFARNRLSTVLYKMQEITQKEDKGDKTEALIKAFSEESIDNELMRMINISVPIVNEINEKLQVLAEILKTSK